MKTVNQWLLALGLGLYLVQAIGAERLGGISDETAPPADQSQAAEENKGDISYRVICSPEGEMLPECGQPPVRDSWVVNPSKTVVPDVPVASETEEQAALQAEQEDKAADVTSPAKTAKNTKSSKKASKKAPKKTVKKSGKKTTKAAKKAKTRR